MRHEIPLSGLRDLDRVPINRDWQAAVGPALPPEADIRQPEWHVRYVLIADVRALFQRTGIDKPSIQIGRNHCRVGNGIGID